MHAAGDLLGRYKIVSKIGEGGMGEVYLAEDPKLNRQIALKILPVKVGEDAERMHRFVHEAKSASALNHPNIITIYEINDDHDVPFIAMEFVEGETISKRIKRNAGDLQKTLDIAIQIAAALTAAHEANVIHRDIKPDNIILRPDGLVKVLDFGLAKLAERTESVDLETPTAAYTSPGMVMGTVGYMSPEQARGRQVDARSDIFSFGAVLYQMLAGKLPFEGDNNADMVASILHHEPVPLSEAAPYVPREFDAIVRKMLRKNREERFQTVRELLADLKDLRSELSPSSSGERTASHVSDAGGGRSTDNTRIQQFTTAKQSGFSASTISEMLFEEIKLHPMRTAAVVAGIALLITASVLAIKRYTGSSSNPEAFQSMRFEKLTSTGNVADPLAAISPDGRYVAYVVRDGGQESLWLKQSAAASNVQIKQPDTVKFNGLTFSPDGNHIYYVAFDKNGGSALFQVPVLGTNPRKLLTDVNGPPAFSSDGKRMSFFRSDTVLMVSNSDGSAVQAMPAAADGAKFLLSAWSPDGETLAAAVFYPGEDNCGLVQIDVKAGTQRPIPSPKWLRISGLVWPADANGLLISGRDLDTQLSQIWHISYPDGAARRITNDLSSYQGLSVTADGKTIASTQQNRISNIWTVSNNSAEPATKLTSELGKDEGMSGVAWTPDGSVVYTTRIKGAQDIWITDGGGNRQLTIDHQSNFSPIVSPDGRTIVFVSTRTGNANIWKSDLDGNNPVQLTNDPGIEGEPAFSPDGKWIFYDLTDTDDKTSVWKIGIEGGAPTRFTSVESGRPIVSTDGKFVASDYGELKQGVSTKIAIFAIDGGAPLKVLDLPAVVRSRTFRWSPDGKSFIFVDRRDAADNLWGQPIDSSPARQLTNFTADRIYRFDVSPIGRGFVLARGNESSDVVTISNFR